MSDIEPALLVEKVAKSYGDVHALKGVSLAVGRGEFVALLGPNGAGKSTLLQLLTGLFSPDSGHISVLGKDMSKHATKALADIGVVFQEQTLDLELTVKGNLLFHADLHGLSRKQAKARIAVVLEEYGLSALVGARARTLSGGNRRKVELARALLHRPSILLMDEASVGLDPNSRRALLEEVKRLATHENMSVLWTTHLIDEVQYADRVILLDRGHAVYDGTTGDLLRQEGTNDVAKTILNIMGRDDGRTLAVRGLG